MLRKFLICALVLVAPALHAANYECTLRAYLASSGFDSQEGADSWVPEYINIKVEDSAVVFNYFETTAIDTTPKKDGSLITARDEFSAVDGGVSWLIKATLTIDTATRQAKFKGTNSASGYEDARFGGEYSCK